MKKNVKESRVKRSKAERVVFAVMFIWIGV